MVWRRSRLLPGLLALLAGCSDARLNETRNAAVVGGSHVASAVYVGDGLVLTNWHVCLLPLFDESLDDDDYVRLYNDPGDGTPAYREGASIRAFYCPSPDSSPGDPDYQLSEQDQGGCLPLDALAGRTLTFTQIAREAHAGSIAFASWDIDVCIFEVTPEARAALDAELEPLVVGDTPARLGQPVVVAGHQRDAVNDVGVDSCAVIATTELVVDPDPIAPSPLEVPSFAIDCVQVEHGSSGSPVFDARSGALLGLVWTGVELGSDRPTVYVTAIDQWLGRFADRPPEQYSRLAALLAAATDRTAAP